MILKGELGGRAVGQARENNVPAVLGVPLMTPRAWAPGDKIRGEGSHSHAPLAMAL